MKLMSEIASKELAFSNPRMVRYISALGGWRKLDKEFLSSELSCPICQGVDHFTIYAYDGLPEKVWICGKLDCVTNTQVYGTGNPTTPLQAKRVKDWAVWCQENDIPDLDRLCKFESIHQDPACILKLKNFMSGPKPTLLMCGSPGTGKTYASLGICERFTAVDASCVFITQKQMEDKWLESVKNASITGFIPQVTNVKLLVIDDFGTGEMTSKFSKFLMDLISSRVRWRYRKTIISSNLNLEQIGEMCAEALFDRIRTGEIILFNGPSRRN